MGREGVGGIEGHAKRKDFVSALVRRSENPEG